VLFVGVLVLVASSIVGLVFVGPGCVVGLVV